MRYVSGVKDLGIVLAPDRPGGAAYPWDGGGIREAICDEADGAYWLSYDGAMPGASPQSYWNACEARSTDLRHWEKLGVTLKASALTHPESSEEVYKDFRSASSPWSFREGAKWYRYYIGADHCSPEGVPAFAYSTMLAEADSPAGPWRKHCDDPGCAGHVCFPVGAPGAWDDATASPGQVMRNPKYPGDPAREKKYLMFYSGSCGGVTKRSIGIARTNDLEAADDFGRTSGRFWEKDPHPILPPEEDIENTSFFYEESSGYYWMFTNHIFQNRYTDSVWVYRTRDLERWDPAEKAVVLDASVCAWAKGAVGMPSVVRKDAGTLAMLYDAVPGDGTGHLNRCIGLAEIPLPLAFSAE